eukprot:g559.t1
MGCGITSLLLRLIKKKKGPKMVSVSTQTDDDLIEVLVARRWGERIGSHSCATRIVPPPPPPERKPGIHHHSPQQHSKSLVGPFAPTLEELTKGRASLRPVKSTPETTFQSCEGAQEEGIPSKQLSILKLSPSSSAAAAVGAVANKESSAVSEITSVEDV